MFLPLAPVIIYIIFNVTVTVYILVQTNIVIANLKKKLDRFCSNVENYTANENDVIENLYEKIINLESYVDKLKNKSNSLREENELLKKKK